ncbi:putative ATP /GTP-binding protein [Pseudonocardia sp. Ae168_Ps1]|uniref:tetratricopeptide repeat protein n=1 Tax=unclassified Pseudonocardia TaxID=2619320 RepID=UPI00094B3DC6|nr:MULTISPECIES: tetratricopeptide repeat protein [unclassified Pseudonocardia]OLL71419.1 putative ATP /GTP-binding protein [Pseudonocardia sp. Ae168_Ps1]OLL77032.1 putative ATP /GTP-binding protein [Pseudonocardia sp. Ae150A_Ps1]OLL88856.1 putative ATP /GTP-binding protein [Pseudonocardia sp. Ae263_Ps1]OLL91118.1 putative ATP /GTP-binding protein [Pseudonocardia sp. Ae356_Ps1]
MSNSVFAGSPFLRESAAVDHRAGGARTALRTRHDRAATDVRAAGRSGDEQGLLDATRRLEQLLAAARRELGARDADTLVVEGTLSVAYLLGDDETRGLELAARNLAAREQEFGADHPASLAAADALAAAHRVTGRPEEAVARHEDVITRRGRVLGDAHPCTVASRAALAVARADAGDLRGAAGLLSSTLDTADRFLGPSHPVTDDVRELLAECREALADEALAAVRPGREEPADEPTEEPTGLLSVLSRVPDPREETRPIFFDRPSGPLPVIG